jgi:hypothetical protein
MPFNVIRNVQVVPRLPTSVVINGCDSMERLDQAFEAVWTFKPMSEKVSAGRLALALTP